MDRDNVADSVKEQLIMCTLFKLLQTVIFPWPVNVAWYLQIRWLSVCNTLHELLLAHRACLCWITSNCLQIDYNIIVLISVRIDTFIDCIVSPIISRQHFKNISAIGNVVQGPR